MVFSSATFLLVFLPLTLALYFITPSRPAKNVILFIISIVFYAWGEPVYVLLMLASIIFNWSFALAIDKSSSTTKRVFLIAILSINLLLLGFFKYEGFLADNINALLGSAVVPNLELPLPIGISFFTLQAISYIIDVYRREVAAQRNPLYFGMYISLFPQLIAGPIVRYETIHEQICNRKENLKDFCSGLRLFIVGLAKKVLLANVVAILATKMLDAGGESIGTIGAWAGLIAFTFQIFFDFSGYSDMAIGLGRMFGFDYLRNFNYPYLSKSATEFWRRWHISLSSFFRDYVYIPLGGSRVSSRRWIFNIAIVWCLTGFWHGAAWNYILWGAFFACFLIAEKKFLLKYLRKFPSIFQHVYGLLVVMFGWLLFWIEDMGDMVEYLRALFGGFGFSGLSTFWELTAWEYIPVFAACAIASTPIVPWIRYKLTNWTQGIKSSSSSFFKNDLPNVKMLSTERQCNFDPDQISASSHTRKIILQGVTILADLSLVLLLVMSIASVISGSFNPFIYFRF